MEQYIDNNDIYEMKQQMELLKNKLDKQIIINDKMIQNAIKGSLNKINMHGRLTLILGIAVALFTPLYFYNMDFSILFCAGTFLMLAFTSFKTWAYHKEVWSIDLSAESLLEIGNKVATHKKRYENWKRFGYPMLFVWILALGYEGYQVAGEHYLYFMTGAAFGGIIGGIFGTRMNKRLIRQAEDLLKEIKEIREER